MTIHQDEHIRNVVTDLREYKDDGGLKLNLHVGQIEAYYSKARFIAIISGTQGGKTSFAPHWLKREIKLRGNGDYLYVTPSFTLLDKKALPEFLEVFERHGNLGYFYPSKMKFVFSEEGMEYIHGKGNYDKEKPTTVFFGHAKNPESLESATALAAVLDEAGQNDFKFDSWEAILRRVSLNEGRILICTTPYNLGWLKKEVYDRWLAGDPDYHVINFASTMNPRFPKREAEKAKKRMPKWKYEMFYLGKFSKPAGLIYDKFETDPTRLFERSNACDDYDLDPTHKRVIGVDLGGVNTAAVKYALHPFKPFFVQYAEYYPRIYRTAAEHACHILEHEPSVKINWKISKTHPIPTIEEYDKNLITMVVGTLSEKQWRIEMQSAGLVSLPTFIRDVELGIDRVYGSVATRRLKVFRSCKRTLDEFGNYSREIDSEGNPIANTIVDKAKYHLLDATRYGISYIEDPSRSEEWSQEDVEQFNPDAGDDSMIDFLDDDVDLDNPKVKRLLARQRRYESEINERRRYGIEE